jgi:VWFA-related protein
MKDPLLALGLAFGLLINVFGQQPQSKPAPSPQPTPPAAPAPTPDTQREADDVVRITTKLVQVDATVTDTAGKQVTNLTAEDFEITENGRPQKITNFSYISSAPADAGPGASGSPVKSTSAKDRGVMSPLAPPGQLRPEQVRRAIALVVDDLRMSAEGISSTRQALRKYVDQQMQPGDLVAIIRTSAGIGSLQQFTNDRQQLYTAIEHIRQIARAGARFGAFTSTSMLDRLETQVTDSVATETEASADRRNREGAGSAASQSSMRGVDTERLEGINQFRDTLLTVGTIGALNFVVRGLRELPGRKAVVLFSDGISIYNSDSNTGDRNERVMSALRQLVDRANRASVVFYAIDARGVQPGLFTAADATSGGPQAPLNSGPQGAVTGIGSITPDLAGRQVFGSRSGEMFEGQNGLSYLSRETGGLAVFNNNDLNRGIRRALDDIAGYYLIGYRPEESTFDPVTGRRRYNTWAVSVKHHPGLKVRSRSGFLGIAEQARTGNRTRAEQLMAALLSPFAADGINLQLTSFFLNDATIGSAMRSVLLMDASKVTFTEQKDGQMETALDIIGVTLGENGEIIDQVSRIERIRVSPETLQRFLREGMVYGLNVPVAKPGGYLLRIAVRDAATGRIGSAGQYVEVPNVKSKDQLILSSLVISGNNPDGTAKRETPLELLKSVLARGSSPPVTPPPTPTVVAGGEGMIGTEDPRAGPASRRFRTRMFLNFACVIYKMRREKLLQLTSQVRLYHDGQEVFIGQPTPLDMSQQQDISRLVVARRLFLGTVLGPGAYILHLTVTDASNSGRPRTATRWLDFSIVD